MGTGKEKVEGECSTREMTESASRPLVDFGVFNDNLIKWLILFVKCISRF
jgi:hypothetical protein